MRVAGWGREPRFKYAQWSQAVKTVLKTVKYKVSYDIFFSSYVFRFVKASLLLTYFRTEHHGGFFLESAIFFKAISMLSCIDCIVL